MHDISATAMRGAAEFVEKALRPERRLSVHLMTLLENNPAETLAAGNTPLAYTLDVLADHIDPRVITKLRKKFKCEKLS